MQQPLQSRNPSNQKLPAIFMLLSNFGIIWKESFLPLLSLPRLVVSRILGKARVSMTRTAGRHAHKTPTLISIFDQLITLASSHVGLSPLAKTTRDRRRIMDTIVTLPQRQKLDSRCDCIGDLQCTDKEHECNTDAVAPRHLEAEDLIEWQCKHPNVEDYADCSICPDNCIAVDACSFCLSTPVCPIIRDRLTRKDADDDEDDSVQGIEDQCVPDETASHLPWKDSKEKEQKGSFDQHKLQEIQNLECVYGRYESRDLVERQCPHLAS